LKVEGDIGSIHGLHVPIDCGNQGTRGVAEDRLLYHTGDRQNEEREIQMRCRLLVCCISEFPSNSQLGTDLKWLNGEQVGPI